MRVKSFLCFIYFMGKIWTQGEQVRNIWIGGEQVRRGWFNGELCYERPINNTQPDGILDNNFRITVGSSTYTTFPTSGFNTLVTGANDDTVYLVNIPWKLLIF